jgi:hypothetical protein
MKETVKTIARGMPGVSGVTVVTNARAYYTTRAAAGASGARHSLRPLIREGGTFPAKLGRNAPRDREAVSSPSCHRPRKAGDPVFQRRQRLNRKPQRTGYPAFAAPDTLIPGIRINTSATDYAPIEQLQMMQFKGGKWELFGDIISAETGG